MRVNLGTVDANAHGLDADKCQSGMEANVSSDAGTWLVENGHAELLDVKGVAKQAEVQAVPPKRGSVEKATADLKEYRKRAKGEDD
jgi:hypothetical protein